MGPIILLALIQAAAQPAPPAPADWSNVPWAHLNGDSGITPGDTGPVMRLAERHPGCGVGVGRMRREPGMPSSRMRGLRLDLLLLVAPDGRLLDVVAAPGPCSAIRNYARALINTRYRGKVRAPEGPSPAWYRTTLGFSWEP